MMLAVIFRALAGMLSIPVDFEANSYSVIDSPKMKQIR